MREWLIRQREKNGLTQDQVAKESEIERTYYNMIERGKRRPSVEVAKRISKVLQFDWTYFFSIEGNITTQKDKPS
ncbi:helix-turn-helix domain-containing protein [Enterococcus gallinarum]|uniref:helix-turn-helix transcriptional regulator n=1 Tax=Enterococcus gallinarum TaxID=1353 RepID=UPI002DBBCDB0|nr:helix-turn-helix transcriptional regulator [Enterococcus gallinarum]MEB6064886.1 helix-turn-helix domain-containing protein [Enterococcus gallinarum]